MFGSSLAMVTNNPAHPKTLASDIFSSEEIHAGTIAVPLERERERERERETKSTTCVSNSVIFKLVATQMNPDSSINPYQRLKSRAETQKPRQKIRKEVDQS